MLWISGQRKFRRNLPAKILECFPQASVFTSLTWKSTKDSVRPFDREYNFKVLIPEFFGINKYVVWSLSYCVGKHLMSLEPEHNLIKVAWVVGDNSEKELGTLHRFKEETEEGNCCLHIISPFLCVWFVHEKLWINLKNLSSYL